METTHGNDMALYLLTFSFASGFLVFPVDKYPKVFSKG